MPTVVVELVDTHDLGSCAFCMNVQVVSTVNFWFGYIAQW